MKKHRLSGSALVYALTSIVIMSATGFVVLNLAVQKYHNAFQASGWQESLMLAESGVDLALTELRYVTLTGSSATPSFQSPWSSWSTYSKTMLVSGSAVTVSGSTTILTGTVAMPVINGSGVIGTYQVAVDVPDKLVDSKGNQCYRIRSTGTEFMGGPARVTGEKADTRLRMLSLKRDRFTHQVISAPQVSRTIEVIAKPLMYPAGIPTILAKGAITLNGKGSVDSYNSNTGAYGGTNVYSNATVETDGNSLVMNGGATIQGDTAQNGGTPKVTGGSMITGTVDTNFYERIDEISAPDWMSSAPSPVDVNGNTVGTIKSSNVVISTAANTTSSNAAKYTLSGISLSGGSTLTITGTNVATYVDLVVTGDISVSGLGSIVVGPNVVVSIWAGGNVSLTGGSIVNTDGTVSNHPGNFTIYGIQPGTPGSTITSKKAPSYQISGDGNLSAVIDAPDANVTYSGNGAFFGAIIGNTVTISGNGSVHYDEALGNLSGKPQDYLVGSWFEDTAMRFDQ